MASSEEQGGKNKEEEEGSRGFRVSDRRGQPKEAPAAGAPAGEAPESPKRAESPETKPPAPEAEQGPHSPPITFTTFVFSLSSSALVQLGEIPDPFTKKVEKNLPVAQQTIDLLGMLEQKTEGNLSEEEKKTLDAVLYDLRLRFLKVSGRI